MSAQRIEGLIATIDSLMKANDALRAERDALLAERAAANRRVDVLQRACLLDCQPKSKDDAVYVSLKWRDAVLLAANGPVQVDMSKPAGGKVAT